MKAALLSVAAVAGLALSSGTASAQWRGGGQGHGHQQFHHQQVHHQQFHHQQFHHQQFHHQQFHHQQFHHQQAFPTAGYSAYNRGFVSPGPSINFGYNSGYGGYNSGYGGYNSGYGGFSGRRW